MVKESWRRILGRGIMEEESWRRNHGLAWLAGLAGWCLGVIWEASRRHLGTIWRHL